MSDVSGNGDTATYRKINIDKEDCLEEYIYNKKYKYIKVNGVKYYKDEYNTDDAYKNKWFHIINGKKYYEGNTFSTDGNDMAVRYYTEAAEFKEKIKTYGLDSLTPNDAVALDGQSIGNLEDENGDSVYDFIDNNSKIFDFNNGKGIESPTSNFNQHRRAVIRYTIEKNLSIALNNYNEFGKNHDFRMPKLKETDWDKLLNNISLISFLQGLNIGGRIYNGYSIINNNKNKEVVTEDSIYIADDTQYTRVTDKDLINDNLNNKIGVFNYDFERQTIEADDDDDNVLTRYYYPKRQLGSYTGYVAQTNTEDVDDIYTYLDDQQDLAKIYYTALGRERYSMYKSFRNPTNHKAKIIGNTQSAVGGSAINEDKTYIDIGGNIYNTIPDGYEATGEQDKNGYWKLQEIKRNINIKIQTTTQNIENYSNIPITGKSINYSNIATYVPTGYDIVSITVGNTTIQPGGTYNDLKNGDTIQVVVKNKNNIKVPVHIFTSTKTLVNEVKTLNKSQISYSEIKAWVPEGYEIEDIDISAGAHLKDGDTYMLSSDDDIEILVKKKNEVIIPVTVYTGTKTITQRTMAVKINTSISYSNIAEYVPEGYEILDILIDNGRIHLKSGESYIQSNASGKIQIYVKEKTCKMNIEAWLKGKGYIKNTTVDLKYGQTYTCDYVKNALNLSWQVDLIYIREGQNYRKYLTDGQEYKITEDIDIVVRYGKK